MSTQDLVKRLSDASQAYYNGIPIMDDTTFDALLEDLRTRDPANPFLTTIGATPVTDATPLPFTMASLDKIKPGQPALTKFLKASDNYVLSEKLDGLSALWCPKRKQLYLRGDGLTGQAINHLTMTGLVPSKEDSIIRGEILIRRTDVEPTQIARTIVNGLVHRKTADPATLTRLRFVAYQVLQPANLTRSQQMKWLQSQGFETPWYVEATKPDENFCAKAFTDRRAASAYDIDGIVVGIDQVPVVTMATLKTVTLKNPKDCVAFKMPLADQSATTIVREVLWATSAQGYIIPRLRFDPVSIGGATIEFCTAHNARNILALSIGPGATIRIRRSGDVIPTLDGVVSATSPFLPDPLTWEWAGDADTAVHIRQKESSVEQVGSQLLHLAKALSIAGLGPANCKALVANGLVGPKTLWAASADALSAIIGPKSGQTLFNEVRKVFGNPKLTELTLMVASSRLPRGVGETKIRGLLEHCPDPRKWSTLQTTPTGWTEQSFRDFQAAFKSYEDWRVKEIHWIPYPILADTADTVSAPAPTLPTVCFTGFRDKALEESIVGKFTPVDSVVSTLKILVVADNAKPSLKVKRAQEIGTVEILTRSQFLQKYLS